MATTARYAPSTTSVATVASGSARRPRAGHTKRILCPYHAWQYGRDGEFLHAPKHADGDPFAYMDYGLHGAVVEV